MRAQSFCPEIAEAGLDYHSYREMITLLLVQGKNTGMKQTPSRVQFTKLNIARMNRLDKTTALLAPLAINAATLKRNQKWILLAQGWCGDCAQIIPVIAKIASVADPMIDLRILNPDEHPEVMSAYLTNGAQSVPKLVVLDADNMDELAVWGPRPQPAQEIMLNWKSSKTTMSWDEFEKELHSWYAKDRTFTIQEEILKLQIWHSSK